MEGAADAAGASRNLGATFPAKRYGLARGRPSPREEVLGVLELVKPLGSAARTLPLLARAAARSDPHACQRRS